MIETVLASAAVGFFMEKAAEGAVQAIGSDIYKTALEKLKFFLGYKFAGKPEFQQSGTNPAALERLIAGEAAHDQSFKAELEQLINQLQELTSNQGNNSQYKDVDSVVNTNISGTVTGSNVSGRDSIVGNNLSGNGNVVGGNNQGATFR